ncbi:MAG: GNAT family N-acetyltransferase [Clostridiales bacterium]|nr:GNAT family N-acetyltransferase [Clostridiales bacterium]
MEFVKNYKSNDALRLSFDTLAKNTFGISFEAWYQDGCWNDRYIPYSFEDQGRIIANASANKMTLFIEGQEVQAIQIGTVMTDPEYRRRGLAYELIQKIISDFDESVSLYYLAADVEAMSLYNRCGFSEVTAVRYSWQNPLKSTVKLEKIHLSLEELIKAKKNSVLKGSRFEVVDDEHILSFYYHHGFKDKIYRMDDEILIIADILEGEQGIEIYDVFSKSKFSLNDLVDKTGARMVNFNFDVAGMIIGLEKIEIKNSGWMIRSHKGMVLKYPLAYPKLAQA